jgi:hypothetical protein
MGKQLIRIESGQTAQPFEALVDSGDHITFEASFYPISDATGYEAVICPYGLLTGGAITVGSGNDNVAVAAMTLSAPGMTGADDDGIVSVSADSTVAVTRGVSSDTHMITSITVAADGTITPIAGTDSTAFSETRGAAGGPPFIPVGSIEIGQVRTTSVTAAVILASEIKAVPGTHLELADQPGYTLNYATGELEFYEALPLIHTGSVPKKVYLKGATPIFAKVPNADAWVAAKETNSVSSIDTYDGAIGSATASLGQASFTAVVKDGISDNWLGQIGENVWVEYRPNEDALLPKQLTQGILAVSVTNPARGSKVASATLTASKATTDITA